MKNPCFSRTLALVAPVSALTLSQSFGAADYFLKIEGIKGESSAADYKDSIDIQSFSWGLSQASGGSAGKATFKEFTFVKQIDKSSPKLMLACATGERIPSLTFTVTRPSPDGKPEGYYTITLTDLIVSSYQSSAGPRDAGALAPAPPTVSVSARFWKIGFVYTALDGSVESVSATNPNWETVISPQ